MKKIIPLVILLMGFGSIIFFSSCNKTGTVQAPGSVTKQSFGTLPGAPEVNLYTLVNHSGITLKVTNYGCRITSLLLPDKNGKCADVVLGFDSLAGYLSNNPYFGAVVGRYGNRIAKGKFEIDGNQYTLAQNNGVNHLHGGLKGFDKVVWKAEDFATGNSVGLKLHYLSKDGEEGYPGNLNVDITYTLTDDNQLIINYNALSDKATPINLTQHSYFNLAGGGDIKAHELMIASSKYTVVDSTLIPTGELRDVKGTPYDFTTVKAIGKDLIATGGNPIGYDHNFVLNTKGLSDPATRVTEPVSGRTMEVYTDQPGVQFYTSNFLDGTITGKYGRVYAQYSALCLETQHFPDSPNQPAFPNTILKPGVKFAEKTVFRFSVVK